MVDSDLPQSRCLVLGDPTATASDDRKTGRASLLALCLAAMTRQTDDHAKSPHRMEAVRSERAEVF